MQYFNLLIVIIQLTFFKVSKQQSLDDSFRNSCASSLSCTLKAENNNITCYCDAECRLYKDCCFDVSNEIKGSKHSSSCYKKISESVNMIDKCSVDWKGSKAIKDRCENLSDDISDPVGLAPVTDISTRKTYKNNFCAICNFNTDASVSWLIGVTCNSIPAVTEVPRIENMIYRRDLKMWGFCTHKSDGSVAFTTCSIVYKAPDNIASIIRKCEAGLIEHCSSDWPDDSVRRMCQSYKGVIYEEGWKSFKNYHCAVCNHASIENIMCTRITPPGSSVSLNFNLLLDINENGGGIVGLENLCKNNEVWDPFSKKCRSIVCGLPGFVMKDGKCVSV